MIVELNLDTCTNLDLTPNQYVLLFLLINKYYGYFDKHTSNTELEHLMSKGYIVNYSPEMGAENIPLDKNKLKFLLTDEESYFYELLSTYPLKVTSGKTVRYVRPSDVNSKQALALKKKYDAIIKSKATHDLVIACLKIEVETRIRGNNLAFMQNLETWINQRTWEQYKYLLDERQGRNTEDSYGEEVI